MIRVRTRTVRCWRIRGAACLAGALGCGACSDRAPETAPNALSDDGPETPDAGTPANDRGDGSQAPTAPSASSGDPDAEPTTSGSESAATATGSPDPTNTASSGTSTQPVPPPLPPIGGAGGVLVPGPVDPPPDFDIGSAEFCSRDGWCWLSPLPHGLALHDVFAVARNDVWSVGNNGQLMHFDGSVWKRIDLGIDTTLSSVFAFAWNDVWIGGEEGLFHFDGESITRVDDGIGLRWVTSIWGPLPGELWLTNDGQNIVHYQAASGFSVTPLPLGNTPWEFFGFGSDDVHGFGPGSYYRWDGSAWALPMLSGALPDGVRSMWGTSPGDVWFGGASGSVTHYDGTGFTTHTLEAEWTVVDLWGSATDDVFGALSVTSASEGRESQLAHYDGNLWSVTDPLGGGDFAALHGTAADDVWAIGARGVVQHYDGAAWSPRDILTTSYFRGGFAAADDDAWVVAVDGSVFHWDGTTFRGGASEASLLWGITGTGPSDVWVAGDKVLHYDGSAWRVVRDDAGGLGFGGLFAVAPNDVWFSSGSNLQHYDGTDFEIHDPVVDTTALFGFANDDVWAAAIGGYVLHYQGVDWAPIETGLDEDLRAIWGSAPNDLWVVGRNGAVARYQGLGWSVVEGPDVLSLDAIWGRGPNDVYVAGTSGTIFHWDGTGFTQMHSGAENPLNSEWFTGLFGSDRRVFVLGTEGMILSRTE